MAMEIERKFLVLSEAWRAQASRIERIEQGYLSNVAGLTSANSSVRVRVTGEQAWLNVKSVTLGVSRQEYEYPIPVDDALVMLATLCEGLVEKQRHYVELDGFTFEVDEFSGANAGLIVAELELEAEDQPYPKPAWLGREVSNLPRYYNVNLLRYPYAHWTAAEKIGE
jgi:adenylate cyclase